MAKKKSSSGIDPELEGAIADLLKQTRLPESAFTLTERLAIIDRALDLEKLRTKIDDGVDGSAFGLGDDE